ncbi:hypothetical protein ABTX24_15335, partial [Nocardioides sp. NPDC127514]|uniref:hypothetical protein n=1 Tax=Nocardioides sp. NPDC127514 TaxID=3154243 RepID=UPI00331A716E
AQAGPALPAAEHRQVGTRQEWYDRTVGGTQISDRPSWDRMSTGTAAQAGPGISWFGCAW